MITWTLLLRKIKQSHFTLKWWTYHEFHIFELRDKEINVDRRDHHSYWYARLFTVPYFSVRSKTLRYGQPSWMIAESWLSGRERFLFDWLQFSTKRACLRLQIWGTPEAHARNFIFSGKLGRSGNTENPLGKVRSSFLYLDCIDITQKKRSIYCIVLIKYLFYLRSKRLFDFLFIPFWRHRIYLQNTYMIYKQLDCQHFSVIWFYIYCLPSSLKK